ncbi:UDP-glycosyltransferase UGT5-like [Eupeodes corollae]|uniref:UDP-glycosyltransferase UGT5-like n=1 Tax=Eupeodes corollae TaxID=290404 RepID=UPI00248F549C|nr:UDP-glycosyltransferase UGT5-like [Eupeodes corollae]
MSCGIKIVLACFVLATLISSNESARILGFFPTPSKSHLIIHSSVAKALAEQGHDVTVVSTHKCTHKNPPYRYFQIDVPGFSQKEFSNFITNPPPIHKRFFVLNDILNHYANTSLHQPQMQKLMAEESFDLVILGYFFNEFLLGVPAHFKCPVILSFMIRTVTQLNQLVGNPEEVAYVPSVVAQGKQPFGFFDRVKNFLIVNIVEKLIMENLQMWYQADLYNQNFPADKYPSFKDMLKNVSLVMSNHYFIQGPIRPHVPAVIEIGGIQIKSKPDPLPEDLKSILDNATEHGVVYFSLGSNVQGSTLEPAKLQAIFNALAKLPQKVLWKWGDSEVPGHSPNIIFKNWLPQDDILPHPNVRLFITHGGQGSVVESTFHGVPMVGIPIFGDQIMNMDGVVKQGFGLAVDYKTFTEEDLSSLIDQVLNDRKYKENIQKFATLYKDRPLNAQETAVFWAEYVLRHHGAPHMQSPAVHLNAFQLHSIDVIGFLLACLYIVFRINKFIFLFVKSKIWKVKSKKE